MEDLEKQVRRAGRRLIAGRFVAALGWCWFATLLLGTVLILVGKFWPLGVADWAWVTGSLGLGLLAAIVWAIATGRGAMDAAIEIDRRFALKERVSSTLALSEEERQSEVGRALVDDAVRRVKRIDVAERLRVTPGRPLLLPLLPLLLAVLVALLVNSTAVENPAAAGTEDPAAARKQVKKSSKRLERKLAEQRKKAEKQGLKEAEQLLKMLEKEANDLARKDKVDRKQALVKLNDLAKQIKERRRQKGGADNVKQQLNQLKNTKRGPADKFARAIKQGDFKKAMEELEKLKKQINEGRLDEKKRKELAEQLDQMKDKVKRLCEAHKKALADMQKQADKLRQAGQNDKADQLEQQIDNLKQQLPQMDQMDQLAQQMGRCSKCLRNGQLKDAGDALDQLQAELGDLQKQLDELEMLDEALDQLAQCCEGCQGQRPGMGMGSGRGKGDRPEEKNDTAFRNSRVPQKVGKGAASVVGLADGPNKKGQVNQEIKNQLEATRHQSADPLTGQRMPRKHRQHAREYFDRFRKGE